LDISGNQIGDTAATELAEALSKNQSLKILKWDENSINVGGWQALCSALKSNKTLQQMPNPERDIVRAISSSRDKVKQREKIYEVMGSISQILKENIK